MNSNTLPINNEAKFWELKPKKADISYYLSDELSPEDQDKWARRGIEFLERLSPESFHWRFGSPKPQSRKELKKLVKHFVGNDIPHEMAVITIGKGKNKTIIGAASLFDFKLRKQVDGEWVVFDSEHISELSLTVADEYQGQGIGKALVEASIHKIANAPSEPYDRPHIPYIYTSFTKSNTRSRDMITSIIGTDQMVANRDNEDIFWRVNDDYQIPELERIMAELCGNIPPRAEELESKHERNTNIDKIKRNLGKLTVYLQHKKES